MKKLILFILTILIIILISDNYIDNYYVIPKESIRIRIVPNSNNIQDQYLKKQVKNNIEVDLKNDLKESNDIQTTRTIIKSNLNKYKKTVETVLKNEKVNQKYNIDYGYHHFPEKVYKGIKYEEGEYESLLITLGEGRGDNWWCVLFPPICLLEDNSTNKKTIEYNFYIKEMLNKYVK